MANTRTALVAALAKLGDEVQDVDEETFDIFSQPLPSHDLGMVDATAETLSIPLCGRDFEITQSPGILKSDRAGGTTGAAVWRTNVVFAEWMGSPWNSLFQEHLLDINSTVLELGAGISGVLPCLLGPRVRRVVATDQPYILKTLRANIAANTAVHAKKGRKGHHQSPQSTKSNIDVVSLDWENDDVTSIMTVNDMSAGVEAIVICDCIFNYALIDPLVQTCMDICKLRMNFDEVVSRQSTICIVVQQLRQPEVFEQWLTAFYKHYRVWRVRNEALSANTKEGSGFVIHLGILREPGNRFTGDVVRLG